MALMLIGVAGCAASGERPEFSPSRWAPAAVQREWQPAPNESTMKTEAAAAKFIASPAPAAIGAKYDLPALIDLALRLNPETRGAWESARAAAAAWGISRAPYYPTVRVDSESGYERAVDQVPKHWGTLKNWRSSNLITADYVLADFGRRAAGSREAREELMAANFGFNRKIQEVVFAVEKNYYLLDAARADVTAANAILRLAITDRLAVEKRHSVGLATKPDVLLARQREARARYDLENADLAVSDAQADLAVALGMRVDSLPAIESSSAQPVAALGGAVDDLIGIAIRKRPDLAAEAARVRAHAAEADLARAAMYPTFALSGYYGSYAFNYRLSNPPTPQFTAMAPEYAAALTFKWDAFAGFAHVNSIERAEAGEEAARAAIDREEIDVASEVWRAYYAFQTALRKCRYAQALLEASQSAYDSNLGAFKGGLATIVDLLSAERDLADAKYTLIGSRADLLISAAAVAYATGAVPPQARP